MTVTVRPIEARDESVWRELFVAYGVFYETEFAEPQISTVWGWLMDQSHPTKAWVAEIDGAVVGFGHMRTHWDTFTGGPAWFLDDLYTSSAARGHGAGTQIINALRAHADAHGGGTISWITADNNATAQSVYDKLATRQTWVTYEMGS
jgi:GNAT superfamily N-acetyltransferase